jgi:hypothetical protein
MVTVPSSVVVPSLGVLGEQPVNTKPETNKHQPNATPPFTLTHVPIRMDCTPYTMIETTYAIRQTDRRTYRFTRTGHHWARNRAPTQDSGEISD